MAKFNAEALVELVRPHRFLYDNRQPDFKDTQMKENRWNLIGAELGITGEDAAKKFGNMKDRWRRLKNTQEASRTSGSGRDEVPKITWRYFNIMDSLMAKERAGTVISNLVVEYAEPDHTTEPPASVEGVAGCSYWDTDLEYQDGNSESAEQCELEEVLLEARPVEAPAAATRQQSTNGPPKKKKKRSKGACEEMEAVRDAYVEAMNSVSSQGQQPRHRCSLFFDFMAESAKTLSAEKQDLLMRKCHAALNEVQEG